MSKEAEQQTQTKSAQDITRATVVPTFVSFSYFYKHFINTTCNNFRPLASMHAFKQNIDIVNDDEDELMGS